MILFIQYLCMLFDKGGDGGEYLLIPLDKPTLTAFLENVQEN